MLPAAGGCAVAGLGQRDTEKQAMGARLVTPVSHQWGLTRGAAGGRGGGWSPGHWSHRPVFTTTPGLITWGLAAGCQCRD